MELQLSPEDRARLERLAADRDTSQKHVWRAQIILLSGDGVGAKEIMRRSGFKPSNDPAFAEKLADVAGLYPHPPDRALVPAVDEKSQIQALDRTQPGLPLKAARAP